MLGRWLSGTGFVVLCSVTAFVGCSSSDTTTATTPGADAGTGTDGSANGDSGGGGTDAGGGEQDSGPPVANVAIKYGACPVFAACGGDTVGKWTVSGGCLGEDTFAAAKQGPCAGIQESDVVIKAGGTVEATATNVKRKTAITLTAKLAIPAGCAAQVGGDCQLVKAGLTSGAAGIAFDTATCVTAAGNGCACDVAKAVTESSDDAYTVSGNTLSTLTPPRTFDYCVAGSKNTYTETTQGALPIFMEITK